ncbi:hypothetical protein CIL05_02865 [Virgibacillus profundi]|uniref:DUF2798 domain-containing protein n=1 Tax=Virgibacillus profundi TaxID=2024555 RepID=A0A2A2IK22_9BACI|nr:hypothetical protein [Virgibacillus profundi]PAV31614.1 hypothetical protein CIL05_02865 [Virgibacillus profundi]PXY55800.1 hypothetical protein CIT14_02870 [Virgibacillus profundi]
MHEETRLPRNGKEFILFLAIISVLSVNIIAPIIMGFEFGFKKETYVNTLQVIPFVWICVILLVTLVANPIVSKLVPKFVKPTDGFNARILFNILFSVTILSILLTVIGSWIGMREISLEPIQTFFYAWPRNFFIAFWVEMLIAQPIARFAMKKLHESQASKAVNV